MSETIVIEDRSDPFSEAILDLLETFAKKNADYATHDKFSNFRDMARQLNISPVDTVELMIACKMSRLRALRANGRLPENESTKDTRRDIACYALIQYALTIEEARK